ncbi:hypothetical protein [Arthrobacter sp. CJ23]|uniref:hypothetical protein n=1 Tax=Arthrobacter sp. CJ23 TaxID=2972479 RepID=UPI00215B9CA7|nr:hypothetical protein [Arthrobacter sp. CJ23]UVJ40367.1 hypothetical protein NVV90_04085 [Arthrobacter sp. CJ23]
MNASLAARIGSGIVAWIEAAYFHQCVDRTPEGALETTRYGWLPALSGVTVASTQAAKWHEESARPGT